MIFRQTAFFSLFVAASSGAAFAQARVAGSPTITPIAGAPTVPNNGGGATNPGITPPPQPVTPNSGAGTATNQALPSAGAQGTGGATNQANPSRRVSRRQNNIANTRQTTVNQAGTALDQTAARRQGDMTDQRRNGSTNDTAVDTPAAQPAPVY